MIVPAPGSEGLAVLRDAFPASFRRFSAVLEKITCPKPLLSNRLNRRPKILSPNSGRRRSLCIYGSKQLVQLVPSPGIVQEANDESLSPTALASVVLDQGA